jgi:hypothetical protein
MDKLHAPTCIWLARVVFPTSAGIGEQGDVPGAFNGTCQDALVSGASPGLTARTDLAVVRDEPPEHIPFFVIDTYGFVSAKLTEFRAGKEATLSSAAFAATLVYSFISHDLLHIIRTEIHLR